ncbi:hypothetical protein KOR42_42810 [Thalassoglobus neptunius]|uniref:Uncharacterized protein n=1 Tax=Thalassoglobus neptunius TaxID=1938619 RepID=A0A5C5W9Q0_9PLAN|nr:hypothetical protein [Thalassoglobus neptunius]TWT47013.1 hypothetical protein KOR42_42810 [Thalassoglobus neptunius]
MSYQKTYTYQEVHDLLCESEGRPSPKSKQDGHAIGLHADGREDITHRNKTVLILAETIEQSRRMDPKNGVRIENKWAPGVDSRFTSRADMVKALYQAINSGAGQSLLQQFDVNKSQKEAKKVIPLAKPIPRIERFTKSTGAIERGLFAHAVFLYILRLGSGVHLQTFYPSDVRTS